jgi:hypothetical protein
MPTQVKPMLVYDSVLTRALSLVTLTPICFARAMMSMRLRAETEWAISAAKVVLCMRRRSTSLTMYC